MHHRRPIRHSRQHQSGDYATIAAQVGISGHLNIGSKSTLGAKTGVISDIPENSTYWGMPAFPTRTLPANMPPSKTSGTD
ncbi:MAG: hypothetical protein ACLSUW_01680 [Akkermansia sp.]